jgi:TPR repeat protein
VPQDYVSARMWFELAAAQGEPNAKKSARLGRTTRPRLRSLTLRNVREYGGQQSVNNRRRKVTNFVRTQTSGLYNRLKSLFLIYELRPKFVLEFI